MTARLIWLAVVIVDLGSSLAAGAYLKRAMLPVRAAFRLGVLVGQRRATAAELVRAIGASQDGAGERRHLRVVK